MESSGTKGGQGPETRISGIEQRIARIESFLNLNQQVRAGAAEPAAAPGRTTPVPADYAPPAPPAPPASRPQEQAVPGSSARPKDGFSLSGAGAPLTRALTPGDGNWLGVTAVFCFILAAGLIIKLSIQSGWLTPERQIGLAVLFGLALIALGLITSGKDREYSSLLPGAGVVILYLAVFAAHRLHALLPFEAAIALTGAVSGSWLAYAVAVMAFAFSRRDGTMAKSATFVLGFAAVKALLVDAASAPTTVSIMCLLFTGAVLYGAGLLFRTISAWGAERPPQKAA